MKFRAKFRLILERGLKFNGANLDFVLNPRLKVRRDFRHKIYFRARSFGHGILPFKLKFYAKAHRRDGEKSLAVYKFHAPPYKTEIKILISSPL